MKVYIAGPMSNIKSFNIPAFDAAAEVIRSRGFEVVSPAELDDPEIRAVEMASEDGNMEALTGLTGESWGDFLSRDVKLIADTGIEGVVVLPRWWTSRGARLEVTVATLCGLWVAAYDPALEPGFGILDKEVVDAGRLGYYGFASIEPFPDPELPLEAANENRWLHEHVGEVRPAA